MSVPTVTATGPADLVSAIPFLLGFHPTDSVVVLIVEDRIITACGRADLAACMVEGETASLFGQFIHSFGETKIAVVAYSDEPVEAIMVIQNVLRELLRESIMEVIVSKGKWWLMDEPQAIYEYDAASSRIGAELAFEGFQSHQSRRDLETVFDRPSYIKPFSQRSYNTAASRVAAMSTDGQFSRLDNLLDKALFSGAPATALSTGEQAELLHLLDCKDARDAFWLKLSRSNADKLMDVFLHIAHRCPDEKRSTGAIAVAGLCGWQGHYGAYTTIALDKLDQINGAWHPMAEMLKRIQMVAWPPAALVEVQEAIRNADHG